MHNSGFNRFIVSGFPNDVPELKMYEFWCGTPWMCLQMMQSKENYTRNLIKKGSKDEEEKQAQLENEYDTYHNVIQPLVDKMGGERKLNIIDANNTDELIYQSAKRLFMPEVTLLIGSAGSGVDEMATYLGREYSYALVKVSHLLRAEAKSGSLTGKAIARCLQMKRTVPVEYTIPLLLKEIRRLGRRKILISDFPQLVSFGYPMVHDQVFALDNIAKVQKIFVLQCAKSDKLQRCPDEEIIENSLEEFNREKNPVVRYYQEQTNIQVYHLDTEDLEDARIKISSLLN